ncbi:MAG: glycerophosphodiester phosphodiesterase, partial [Francisellaceae bacterium]|nr:glycerophosphodiester phosphodiesterase [Francisellaceae bacterium]
MHSVNCEILLPKKGVIAHRGVPSLVPENTLASFKTAAKYKIDWIELDVMQCASGEWVVIHDTTLNRTTAYDGFVAKTPYEIIKDLDAGSWFSTAFKAEKIPLLEEVLQLVESQCLNINIEIKPQLELDNQQQVASLMRLLHLHYKNPLNRILLSSFDHEFLKVLKMYAPEFCLGVLSPLYNPEALALAIEFKNSVFTMEFNGVSAEQISMIKQLNLA